MIMVFFFNDTATTEIYTLSLHDALPISRGGAARGAVAGSGAAAGAHPARLVAGRGSVLSFLSGSGETERMATLRIQDRKSTRLNSSHANISYAVFCLKKKRAIHLELVVS